MNVLLVAVNAKYIHTNPAIYSLKGACVHKEAVTLAEYTINHQREKVLADIYGRKPDVLAFSCYIWNIAYVEPLIRDLHLLMPDVPVWLGGPEVSYDVEGILDRLPGVAGILTGEGEQSFSALVSHYVEGTPKLDQIPGLAFWKQGIICKTGFPSPVEMDSLPFYHRELTRQQREDRILYYESSRGCPFSCSYCLSSLQDTAGQKKVRFKDIALVKKELSYFLEQKVPRVKFLDRTFNCSRDRALEIWTFIREHDNGITNFHFEIGGDLLDEESLKLLETMRPGAIQLEIGIQSVQEKTLREIHRVTELSRLFAGVKRLAEKGNVHCHVDLIAGLPYEDFAQFQQSFDQVYALGAHQLQLGFLKVLKGSLMEKRAASYGLVHSGHAPYEVLSTKWLSYEEIVRLKKVEEMVESYANSGQFCLTLPELIRMCKSPFSFFDRLGSFYEQKGYLAVSHARVRRYEILLEFYMEELTKEEQETKSAPKPEQVKELLVLDLYAREPLKSRPSWAPSLEGKKEQIRSFYEKEAGNLYRLKGYEGRSGAQLARMTHLEPLLDGGAMLFTYQSRDPITGNGQMQKIPPEELRLATFTKMS